MEEQSRRSKVEKEVSHVGIVKKRGGGGCERGESLALDWEADIGDTLPGETLTRFGELDTMMSADVDYKYWSTKVLGSQTNQT